MKFSSIEVRLRKLRILDYDSEARAVGWYGGMFNTKQPTAIAWKFVGERAQPRVKVIGESDRSSRVFEEEREMLSSFCLAYDEADIVMAHFVRGYDLRTINGALLRLGMPLLGPKLTICTKDDLVPVSGLSKSMENLSAMIDARHTKFQMDTSKWFLANTLQPEGIDLVRARVVSDVKEHIELFGALRDLGALSAPRMWDPQRGSGTSKPYHA